MWVDTQTGILLKEVETDANGQIFNEIEVASHYVITPMPPAISGKSYLPEHKRHLFVLHDPPFPLFALSILSRMSFNAAHFLYTVECH